MTPASAAAVLDEILRLDILPRHLGIEPPQADRAEALALATELVASGRDKNLPPLLRACAFLPFLHSAAPLDRERTLALFAGLRRETQEPVFELIYEYAQRQRDRAENREI